MILWSIFFLIELLALYLLSRRLTGAIYGLFLLLSKSKTIAISIVSVIMFPGTVIHELSHLLIAEVLMVPTGKLTLTPDIADSTKPYTGGEVKAGTVEINRTDPFRRSIIGLAPLFVGISTLVAMTIYSPRLLEQLRNAYETGMLTSTPPLYVFIIGSYIFFTMSNSMFSSKEDLVGVPAVGIVMFLLIGASYMAGFRIGLTAEATSTITNALLTLVKSLGIVLGVNVIILILTQFLVSVVGSVTGRRLVKN